MPRMSPELLLSSHSYLNPLSDRELDLRGYQIPAIENLGITKDSLDSIDLTDNSIRSLINFPKMSRLKHLYVSNNPVTFLSPNLAQALPNLTSLVLSNCNLNQFNQLFLILKQFKRLEFLVLIGNPVCKMKLYRDWCIFNCSKIRILDFKRVKHKERKTAVELFYDPVSKGPTALAQSLSIAEATDSEPTEDSAMITNTRSAQQIEPGQLGRTLTAEERERIKRSIEEATSVEEVRRLKRMLEQGFIPREDRKTTSSTVTSDKNNLDDTNVKEAVPEKGNQLAGHDQDHQMQDDLSPEEKTEKPEADEPPPTKPPSSKKRPAKTTKAKAPPRSTRSRRGAGDDE